ncbi:MAG: ribosomal L7Ae/L30e/S12e/Gadd45 family protein [Clostridia bacterium]|nr:ribosomal L7Ae/L30e/S12e/Gadd45 family protein [Clostridia bacterium]
MNSKILTLLGFASKAARLSYGAAASSESIKNGKAKLIIVGCDISEKSAKEIRFLSDKYSVDAIFPKDITTITISNAVGRNCGILSVNDDLFASAIAEEYGRKC